MVDDKHRFAALMGITLIAATFAMPLRPQTNGPGTPEAEAWAEEMASMNRMHAQMATVQASASSDMDFVRLMMPHHEAAIGMAEAQLKYGRDPQMCRLAQEIVTDQQSEMELMKLWLKHHEPQTRAK